MQLSQLELMCIKFITKFYGGIWPFPYFWNFADNTLRVNKEYSCKTFCMLLGFGAFTTIVGMINSIVYPILLPNHPFGRIDKFIQILTCVTIFALNYLIFVSTLAHPYDSAAFFNAISSIEDALGHRRNDPGRVKVSAPVILLIPLSTLGIFFVPFVYVVSDFEPFRYLFDYILPHPMYRGFVIIFLSFWARVFLCTVFAFETFRGVTYMAFFLLVATTRFDSILKRASRICLKNNSSATNNIAQQLIITLNTGREGLTSWVDIGLSVLFIAIVMITWLCIKGSPSRIGLFIYCWFLTLCVFLITMVIISLKVYCKLFDRGKALLLGIKLQAKFLYARHTSHKSKVNRLVAESHAPLRINYSLMGPLGESFLVTFVYILLLRIYDAILVIDFK